MSVPDPDEVMDTHAVEEPVDENDFETNNANEMDDDFGGPGESLPVAAREDRTQVGVNVPMQIVNTAPVDLDSLAASYKMFEKLEGTQGGGLSSEEHGNGDEAAKSNIAENGHTSASQNVLGIQRDNQWVEATNAKANARFDALYSEFKRQKEEGVKESTRRAMDELFQHQIYMGRLHEAAKLFSSGVREYCTTPKHVVQMLLSWVEVSIYLCQWHRVDPLIVQIERAISEALESETSAGSSARGNRYPVPASQLATRNMKEFIDGAKAKIAAVTALFRLHSRAYKAVAEKCLQIDLNCFDYPNLLSAKDIAVFGTLCALATFDRADLKEKVLGNALFRKFLDSEPKLIELLQKFVRGAFGPCLDIMEEVRDQFLLNMYVSPHLKAIYCLIRRRAIVQYFAPFAVADIRKMAVVFRVSIEELENELVELIESGGISARIDAHNKVLHAKQSNKRAEVYKKALALTRALTEIANGIVLHSALHEAQICVGQSDSFAKGPRRRPAQDDFGERAGSGSSSSSGFPAGRSFMSRFFGGSRPGAPGSFQPSSQSAEADSSNEKALPSTVKMAKVSAGTSDEAVSENTRPSLPVNASDDVPMASHSQASDGHRPPPVPFPKDELKSEEQQEQRK